MDKILIVEDNSITALNLKDLLKKFGAVEIAKDGVEGLEKIKQNRYDVVISDYLMPGMNGEELYLEILKLNQGLVKRVIFISGVTNDFLKSYGNVFLPKPFYFKKLIEALKELIPLPHLD